MRKNGLFDVWSSKRYALNAWLSIGSSYSAEVLGHLDYDAVTVDLQHGMMDVQTAMTMMQAISTGKAVPMVRSPANDANTIQRLLDMGAYGVIAPMINTAEECRAFVSACRYPPKGDRSIGPSRGLLYGGADYVDHADANVLTWAMIETDIALRNLDEIVNVEGLDGVYIGPTDLSLTLGYSIGPFDERLFCKIDLIVAAAKSRNLRVGVFCPDTTFANQMIERGCDLITVLNDAGLLRRATASIIKEIIAR